MKIRTKFLLAFLITGLLPLSLTEAFNISHIQAFLKESIIAEREKKIEAEAEQAVIIRDSFLALPLTISRLPVVETLMETWTENPPSGGDEAVKEHRDILRLFSRIMDFSPQIDQMRLLDASGRERVRVHRENGKPAVVPDKELQNKSGRDYFRKIMKIGADEIYVSALDLNVEHEQVERPLKPVLRIATPLLDKNGRKTGIAIVNYDMRPYLDSLRKISIGSIILMDEKGQFLLHPDREKEFGLQLGTGFTYFLEQPELIENTARYESRTYHDPGSREYRIWKKIYYAPDDTSRFWVLFSVIDESVLLAPIHTEAGFFFGAAALSALFIILFSLFMANRLSRPLQDLCGRIENVGGGRKTVSSDFHPSDEIKKLQREFDSMLTRLQEEENERKNAEEDLKKSHAALELFSRSVSHDLKAPLANIKSMAELLKGGLMGELNEEGKTMAEGIERNVYRMKALIEGLLAYSLAKTGKTDYESLDLNALIKEILQDMKEQIRASRADIRTGQLPGIRGNRLQIERLFQNLLTNALKYVKPGESPRVEITGRTDAGGKAVITVRDHGIGFDPQLAKKIFEPFVRAASRSYEGSGLGLATCKHIVESHKGELLAESKPGRGSIFTITLPSAEEPKPADLSKAGARAPRT